jgi:TRAP-type mannitol/chloroaromatic compound transport system permease small subunit
VGLDKLIQFIDAVNDRMGSALSLGILIIFGLLILEVVLRYFFNAPTVWTNELTQMVFGVYVVLSGGHLLWRGGHVNVDILYSRLAPRTRALLDVATSILFFLFCAMLLYFGGALALESLSRWEHSQSAWNPPLWPVKLTIPLGAILLLLQGLAKLVKDIRVLKGEKPQASPSGH